MKNHTLILGLVACAVFAGNGVVLSQEVEGDFEKQGPGKLKSMDTDGDGQISLDEFLAKAEKRFSKMDADEDGYVTAAEFKEKRKAVRAKSRERREQRRANKDME